ncbi:hypothetical protein GCM10027562_08020 [Arthrobacter pigmenti]
MALMSRHYGNRTALALVFCAGLTLTACDGEPVDVAPAAAQPSATSSPSPAENAVTVGAGTFVTPADADRSEADSTAETIALMLHSWDTRLDRTQTSAAIRARPLMSDEWAATQVEPERNGNQGAWLKPSDHGAYSSPTIIPAATDVTRNVSETKAVRVYEVTWEWVSRDGYDLSATGQSTVTIYLERHHGRWDVVGHHRE